jgi:nitroreductase
LSARLSADPRSRLVVYPAVQNMLLAARALGLTAILTFWLSYKEVKAALGLPAD